MEKIAAIILAAGKGTRIGQELPKTLYNIAGKPMIYYTIDLLDKLGVRNKFVVVGFKSDEVKASIGRRANYAYQWKQLGTADAVNSAIKEITPDIKTILVINGDDSAFYETSTIRNFLKSHDTTRSVISIATVKKQEPQSLGRVIRNAKGEVQRIIEANIATQKQLKIKEVNTGCYCFNFDWLRVNLCKINKGKKGEFYLTDLVKIASRQKRKVNVFSMDEEEWFGINTREQLNEANQLMIKRMSIRKKPVVFFVNLDNTLIDIDRFKIDSMDKIKALLKNVGKGIKKMDIVEKKFWLAYENVRKKKGFIDLPEVCRLFSKKINQPMLAESIKNIFFTASFDKYLKPKAKEFLETAAKFGELIIIAEGDLVYQPIKIRNSSISKLINDHFVFENIFQKAKAMIKVYQDWQIILVDDKVANIEKFRELKKNTYGIWIKQGKYAKRKAQTKSFAPQATVMSLNEAIKTIRFKFHA